MTVSEYLGSAFSMLVHGSKIASSAPAMALLGVCTLGCIIGIIFKLVGGK